MTLLTRQRIIQTGEGLRKITRSGRFICGFSTRCTQRNIDYLFLFLRKPIAAPAMARRINKITGCGRVRLAGCGAGRFANSIGILSCDTATVLGSKRHCEYACSAAPSSCWFPVLLSIRAPVTLPVCLSILTKTTPFPVSPCFAHSARYTGWGV